MEANLQALIDATPEPAGQENHYLIDKEPYDRVTHILHKILPPYLSVWAQNVGIEGAWTVLSENPGMSVEQTKGMVKARALDIDSQRDAGASRGLEAHLALESWVKQGMPPSLSDFEPEHQPYAQTLCQFLVDYEPEFECSEVTVWHEKLRYAGTIDAIGRATKEPSGIRHPSILGKRLAWDLKTNKQKRVYSPQHYAQLAAYRHGLDYHGIEVEGEVVVALGPSPGKGTPYRVAPNYFPASFWPPMVLAYRALQEATALNPNGRKA